MSFTDPIREPLLVVDTALPSQQAGIWADNRWLAWQVSEEETSVGLFRSVDACLREAGLTLESIRAIAFCEGPGSMLGIRTAALAIRTWQAAVFPVPRPLYAWRSLELCAHALLGRGEKPPFHVLLPARMGQWHKLSVATGGALAMPVRLPAAELANCGEAVWLLSTARCREEASGVAAQNLAYDVRAFLPSLMRAGLLRRVDEAQPLHLEASAYRKWNQDRHRS